MLFKSVLAVSTTVLLTTAVNAESLYSKNSAVLQLDAKGYKKLVEKSNQISIIEFYAPWCGHCKSLKPKYEKAAKGLKDLAQVAAVNCDDATNQQFCGNMGVKGFPTLKIVTPSRKSGKPIVEDYQGQREAKDIIEAVKSKIPNNVKRITDKGLSAWLKSGNETTKAILFSDKGITSALVKVLANEFLGGLNFAQIRNKEAAATEMFGITEYPTLVILPGGTEEPIKYDGAFSKQAMKSFLGQYVSPIADSSDKKQKPLGKESKKPSGEQAADEEVAKEPSKEAPAAHASSEASDEADGATSVTLEDESNPTESPDPIATAEDHPKPIVVPDTLKPIPTLDEQAILEETCLGEKTSTCVLALLPAIDGEEGTLTDPATTALASLAKVSEKHVERQGHLFPFFSVPASNSGSAILREALKLGGDKELELIAVNARRGWVRRYEGGDHDFHSVENWIDNIRFGEGPKSVLPEGLIVKEEEETAESEPVESVVEEKGEANEEETGESEPLAEPTVEKEHEGEEEGEPDMPSHGEL